MHKLSHKLQVFLHKLYAAVEADANGEDVPSWFDRQCGICDNWSEYTDYTNVHRNEWQNGRHELLKLFGGDLPFNTDLQDYMFESREYRIWDNEKRLAWLEAHQ